MNGTTLMTTEELERLEATATPALLPPLDGSDARSRVLRAVAAFWALNPKMRFGQVVHELIKGKMGIGGRTAVPLFYVEDAVLIGRAQNALRRPNK